MKRRLTELLVAALAVIAIFSAGCGDLASPQPRIATQAPDSTRPASVVSGGKPAAPSRQRSDATPSAGDDAQSEALGATAVREDEATVRAEETVTADETVTAAVIAPTDG